MRVGSHRARSVRYRDERRRAEHRHVIGIVSCARDAEDDEGAGGGAREALERGDAVGFAIEATGAAEIIGDECVVERWTRTTTAAANASGAVPASSIPEPASFRAAGPGLPAAGSSSVPRRATATIPTRRLVSDLQSVRPHIHGTRRAILRELRQTFQLG